jgi:hypothetical protein
MTLTTHAVAGALIGAVASQNLVLAGTFAFVSHLLLDTIPHWDYKLGAAAEDPENPMNNDMKVGGKQFFIDLLKIGFDFWLGMFIVFFMVMTMPTQIILGAFIGAFFGVLPDPLQFVYWKLRPRLLYPIQRFHMYMHAHLKLNDRPFIGISSQVAIIALTIVIFRFLYA